MLAPGGTLAVQMPRQEMAPSHVLMRDIAVRDFPGLFDFTGAQPQVAAPAVYTETLAPLGVLTPWETECQQRLDPQPRGHPVRHFTASTAMRPLVETLSAEQAAAFITAYDGALDSA